MPDAEPKRYRLACLCDLRDDQGRVLLLRRARSPNLGLCSPVGGKLEMDRGESPASCAQREIHEEAGINVPLDRLHLLGLISEESYEGKDHWLLFYYRVLGSVEVEAGDIGEGVLEWHAEDDLDSLPLPETDRKVIWPLVRRHEGDAHLPPDRRVRGPGFFAVHIWNESGELQWRVEQSEQAG